MLIQQLSQSILRIMLHVVLASLPVQTHNCGQYADDRRLTVRKLRCGNIAGRKPVESSRALKRRMKNDLLFSKAGGQQEEVEELDTVI